MSATTVVTTGGLLPRDLLDRVVAGDTSVPGLDPTDYGLVPGERLSDAITRSWNRLQGVWEAFRRALDNMPESEHTATALTRERWLRPLRNLSSVLRHVLVTPSVRCLRWVR